MRAIQGPPDDGRTTMGKALPKAGDTVRVVIEGKTSHNWRTIPEPGGRVVIRDGDKVTVEVIEPEPDWLPGDVVDITYSRDRVERYGIVAAGYAVNLTAPGGLPFKRGPGWGRLWRDGDIKIVAKAAR